MSQPMESAKETLDALASQGELPEEQRERVKWAAKVVGQNLNKIWLRTKVGKPMDALRKLKTGAGQEEVRAAVDALESKAKEIDEESRRRSMVVT